ncbi:uncharacterized protein LOC103174681 [Callorhinchus milii]|uniref:uncharacterized protein LOC103174681 n=1 Tax=Callorhinchus milii TaxID=7868 RepID=UPI0004575CD3|nr:uncharacterized protein LOC103174681 [Callorhinchus milii]|eukprot:gi/632940535/ref/XP_007885371.1/ PREDICTED: uncharacterized protein LOC103174681 [Callorhinchus milii]
MNAFVGIYQNTDEDWKQNEATTLSSQRDPQSSRWLFLLSVWHILYKWPFPHTRPVTIGHHRRENQEGTFHTDVPLECFICRDVEMTDQDSLLQYCDCKSLVAHQKCLLTWIQKGFRNEERLRCKVCTAEYHLQNGSAWMLVAVRWQNWMLLAVILGLMAVVPFTVYRMMTAFDNPPPHSLFKAASICFGLLAESILVKFLLNCCSSKYNKAKMSSFSVRARSLEKSDRGVNLPWLASQNPTTAAVSRMEAGKQEVVKPS